MARADKTSNARFGGTTGRRVFRLRSRPRTSRFVHRCVDAVRSGGDGSGIAAGRLTAFFVVALLAAQARPLVTSVGVMHEQIMSATRMSVWLGGAVVAAPVWCFALGGWLAFPARSRWGTVRVVAWALLVLVGALAARVAAGGAVLLVGTVVACLAVAVVTTLIPPIVQSIPDRCGRARLSASWGTVLGSGSAAGAFGTPLLAKVTSWRWAVGGWAVLAAVALVVWLIVNRDVRQRAPGPVPRASCVRAPAWSLTPRGTAWSLTLHFGLLTGFSFFVMGQLSVILQDVSGVPPSIAGGLFGVAMTIGMPIAAVAVPAMVRPGAHSAAIGATRRAGQSLQVAVVAIPSLVGTGGLLAAPTATPWVWAVSIGLGTPSVVVALALISMRTSEPEHTAALSSMVHSAGYVVAGVVISAVSALHGLTGGWAWSLRALMVVLIVQAVAGTRAGRPVIVVAAPSAKPSRRGHAS